MSHLRLSIVGAMILVLGSPLASCGGKRSTEPAKPVARDREVAKLPPASLENRRGIIGGAIDETAFEFEPDPSEPGDAALRLDGVPEVPADIATRLAPYLESHRSRVAAVDRTTGALLVLARLEDVTQLYAVDAPGAALRQLTRAEDPVAQAVLVGSKPQRILVRSDRDGDELYQIYRVTADGDLERLTNGTSRHGALTLSRKGRVAYTGNARDPGDMDVYVADARGVFDPRRVVEPGGQWLAGAWGPDDKRLMVRHYRSADDSAAYIAEVASGRLTPISVGAEAAVVRDARFSPSGEEMFAVSDAGGDIARLHRLASASGPSRPLTSDIPWDIELVAVSPVGDELAFVANEDGLSGLYLVDLASETRRRADIPAGVISSLQFFADRGLVAFTLATAVEPADAYTYDFATGRLVRWTESESDLLERKPFVEPGLIRVAAADGEDIPAYVYRPPGEGPHPVLLWIHGGPEEQHRPAFDPLLQFFVTELGIAVLAPNIRGSTGYGRRYLNLDNATRRLDAIADIGALLDWVADEDSLDSDRVGIYGGSYGGYVVLASLIAHGDRLAAGCDLVGISHFVTFLEKTSPYRRDQRRAEYGDERDPEVRAFLDEIAPLNNADRIRVPLLVAHGANDPRVPVGEAEQIVEAVRANGVDVWYILAPDEGHGFRKRRNRDRFYAAMATFFHRHLVASPAPVAED